MAGYGVQARGQDLGYAGQMAGYRTQERGQDLGLQGQMAGYRTQERGQDLGLYGQLAGYQNQAAMNAYGQDRSYDLGLRGLSQTQQRQDFDMTRQMYYDPVITQNMMMQGQVHGAPAYGAIPQGGYMGSPGNSSGYSGQQIDASNRGAAGYAAIPGAIAPYIPSMGGSMFGGGGGGGMTYDQYMGTYGGGGYGGYY
jgi:hypothetical protein